MIYNSYVKGICFSNKTQGNSGKMKLKIGSDLMILDWHIHFFSSFFLIPSLKASSPMNYLNGNASLSLIPKL